MLGKLWAIITRSPHADVAELVDALASGASVRKYVKVQVLSSAPFQSKNPNRRLCGRFFG